MAHAPNDHQHDEHGADGHQTSTTDHPPEQHHEHGSHAGHDGAHADHGDHVGVFRDRFWWALALSVPIVVWAPMIQRWFGYTAPPVPGGEWIAPVLGTIVFFYGGWPFLTGGWQEARRRAPGMMLLIAMAIVVAYLASVAHTFGMFANELWWELALLIVIMLLGHWLEMRAIGQARGALAALAELLPDEAERLTDAGATETVAVSALEPGDVVLVRPGTRIPADGVVVQGTADVDESTITGESNPVTRGQGDRVVAATTVADASLRIEVTAVGDDTAIAGIERLVAEAQSSRSRTQVLADRAAALLFYVAVVAGVLTALAWSLIGEPGFAVDRTVTVLVIACPHALGLAIPLVTSISTAKAARSGMLVTDRLALEGMRRIDVVLFDKTGTLTRGEHAVTGAVSIDGVEGDQVLALAAAVEADSEHPLARAIVTYATERVEVPKAANFRSTPGLGVTADVDGVEVSVGGPALLRKHGLSPDDTLAGQAGPWIDDGSAVLYVLRDQMVIGALALADQVRDVSRQAVQHLKDAGIQVAMITGDAQQVADAVATELGIDEVFAEVLPADKAAKVAELQGRGLQVAMVGDGVNDAPALARADVGIAIGAGTDVAIESAGIVLASDDPRGVVSIRLLSRATYRKMLQNLWWAAGYNLAAIPLAAGVLAPIGVVLPMALGAALMSLSTIIVAVNAQLLRRTSLTATADTPATDGH